MDNLPSLIELARTGALTPPAGQRDFRQWIDFLKKKCGPVPLLDLRTIYTEVYLAATPSQREEMDFLPFTWNLVDGLAEFLWEGVPLDEWMGPQVQKERPPYWYDSDLMLTYRAFVLLTVPLALPHSLYSLKHQVLPPPHLIDYGEYWQEKIRRLLISRCESLGSDAVALDLECAGINEGVFIPPDDWSAYPLPEADTIIRNMREAMPFIETVQSHFNGDPHLLQAVRHWLTDESFVLSSATPQQLGWCAESMSFDMLNATLGELGATLTAGAEDIEHTAEARVAS